MKYMRISIIILSILFLFSSAQATTYYIDTDGDDLNAGTSWATAFRNIQTGINAATNGDIVEVNEGTYYESLNNYIPPCGRDILIRSTDPNSWNVVRNTIIDGNGIGNSVAFIWGLGAGYCEIRGFTIKGCSQGVYCTSTPNAIVSNCIIRNNNDIGLNFESPGTVKNSIIYNNTGIGIRASTYVSIRNNSIYGNDVGILVKSCTIADFNNCTIVKNNYGIKSQPPYADISLNSCILWDNDDDLYNCSAPYYSLPGPFDPNNPDDYNDPYFNSCTINYTCIQDINDANGIGNISNNPLFVNIDANDFHLKANSPCVNAGDPNFDDYNDFDIDGEPRIISGRVDMGADEYGFGNIVFRVCDKLSNDVAWLDNYGNIALKGNLTKNATPIPATEPEFRFLNYNGDDAAIIDANSGNMKIGGELFENQSTLQPAHPNSDFIIKGANGNVLGYINEDGDLYLKGHLFNFYID